jgi:hydroxymethylpyrimidine/phosphomethylpyrimidine kinase
MRGIVLIVAGSDSGGGAGIQADIKTVTALGGYAMTAVTALTAQNTEGVFAIHEVPAEFVADQMRRVLADLGADCVKIGMLHRPQIIDTVADVLAEDARSIPLVLDPVMVAKGGHRLLAPEAVATLRTRLLPMASVLTPNLPEAAALVGVGGEAERDPRLLAERLLELGPQAVLVKGGHASGPQIVDVLATRDGVRESLAGERLETTSTHGTGCTLASAIATGLAQGLSLRAAVVRARAYVLEALRTAPGYGRGHGPLNHAHTVRPFPG